MIAMRGAPLLARAGQSLARRRPALLPGQARRGMAFYRQVKFPPRPSMALGFFVVFMAGSQFVEHGLDLAATDGEAEEWVRKAQTEAWGIQRTEEALHNLHDSLRINHGTVWSYFMNAAPLLVRAGVLHKAILPGLRSDEPSIVDPSANLLCDLVAQRRVAKTVLKDSELVDALVTALTQWHESVCLDCGDPVSALDVLVRSVSSLAAIDAEDHAQDPSSVSPLAHHVPALVPVLNKLAALVESGRKDLRASLFQGTGATFRVQGSMGTYGRSPADRISHADSVRLEIWYQDLGFALARLCEDLIRVHPEIAQDLVPTFAALSRGLGTKDLYSRLQDRDWEEALLTAPTLDLGLAIFKQLRETQRSAPETVSAPDWNYMQRLRARFEEVETSGWMRFIRRLEKSEEYLDPIMAVAAAGIAGFLWGVLRTYIALRGVTDPATISERPPPSWLDSYRANPFGSPSQQANVVVPPAAAAPPPGVGGSHAPTYQMRGPPPPAHNVPGYPGGPSPMPGAGPVYGGSAPPQAGFGPGNGQHFSPNGGGYPHGQAPPHMGAPGPGGHAPPPPSHMGTQNAYNPGSGGSTNWKRAMAMRYGRVAATGSMILVGLNEASKIASTTVWLEEGRNQLMLAGIKTLVDVSAMFFVFFNAPYSFVPTVLTTLLSQDIDFSDRVLLETSWGFPGSGRGGPSDDEHSV